MKKIILCCLLLAGLSSAGFAQDVKEGAKAPDFSAQKIDGTVFTLSSLQGKYVVLDFWGSWCKWCIKGFPTKVVIDPKGKIAKVILGEDPAFYTYLDSVLD